MKSAFVSLVSAALLISGVSAQSFTIITPNDAVQCEPTLLTWAGGNGPFTLSVLPGGQPNAPALQNLGTQNGNQVTWNTAIPAGTSVGLTLRDSTGAIAQSAPFIIQPGSDSSCLNGSSSASGSSGSSSATGSSSASAGTTSGSSSASTVSTTSGAASQSSSGSSVATPTVSPPASSPSVTSPSTSKPASPSSGSPSPTPNSVASQGISYGAAAVIGAAVLAVIA